jgi:hypothetical protein
MHLNEHDQAVIEQALKFAAANTTDYAEIGQYVEVWNKLKDLNGTEHDGFRYD